MKNRTFIAAIAALLLLALPATKVTAQHPSLAAQHPALPDTLRYDLGNHIELMIALKNAAHIDKISGLDRAKDRLLQDLQNLEPDILRSVSPLRLFYRYLTGEPSKLIIDRTAPHRLAYSFDESGTPQPHKVAPDSIRLLVTDSYAAVLIADYLEDLQQLKALSLEDLLKTTLAQEKDAPSGRSLHSRFVINRTYAATDGHISVLREGPRAVTYDQLSLQGHGGLGLIRDKWVPDWGLDLGIKMFNKRNLPTYHFGLSATAHFLFEQMPDRSYDMSVNTFVDGYWRRNLSSQAAAPFWLGISAGYLVRRSGDFFDRNTFRASLQLGSERKNIQVLPEFYFSDNLRTAYPGIRFRFGF